MKREFVNLLSRYSELLTLADYLVDTISFVLVAQLLVSCILICIIGNYKCVICHDSFISIGDVFFFKVSNASWLCSIPTSSCSPRHWQYLALSCCNYLYTVTSENTWEIKWNKSGTPLTQVHGTIFRYLGGRIWSSFWWDLNNSLK